MKPSAPGRRLLLLLKPGTGPADYVWKAGCIESLVDEPARPCPSQQHKETTVRERSQHWIAVAATLLLPCLPDQCGVHGFAAGASAATGERYVEVRDFWLKYLQAAGGEIGAKTYGRVALTFE